MTTQGGHTDDAYSRQISRINMDFVAPNGPSTDSFPRPAIAATAAGGQLIRRVAAYIHTVLNKNTQKIQES